MNVFDGVLNQEYLPNSNPPALTPIDATRDGSEYLASIRYSITEIKSVIEFLFFISRP